MPIPGYAEFDGIPSGCKVKGREDMVEILGFKHHTFIPVDVKDATPSATRRHEQVTILKNFDKASPKLYEKLWHGGEIAKVVIHWYMIDTKEGKEKEYFTHTLESVQVVSMKPYMPNVDDPAYTAYKHMEEVGLRYRKITVKALDGNIESSDEWSSSRA